MNEGKLRGNEDEVETRKHWFFDECRIYMSTMKLNLDTACNKFQFEQSLSFLNSVRIIINKYFIT